MVPHWILASASVAVCAALGVFAWQAREGKQREVEEAWLADCQSYFEQQKAFVLGRPLPGSQGPSTVEALVNKCVRDGYLDGALVTGSIVRKSAAVPPPGQ